MYQVNDVDWISMLSRRTSYDVMTPFGREGGDQLISTELVPVTRNIGAAMSPGGASPVIHVTGALLVHPPPVQAVKTKEYVSNGARFEVTKFVARPEKITVPFC